MMITNSEDRVTLEVEALFTTSKVQIERQIIDDNQNERRFFVYRVHRLDD